MVTKEEAVEYFRNTYDLQSDDGTWFSVIVGLDDNRQIISGIDLEENFCRILTPIGCISESKLNDALDLMSEGVVGGLVRIGNKHCVNHAFFLDSMESPADINVLVYAVAKIAYDIKEKILGKD